MTGMTRRLTYHLVSGLRGVLAVIGALVVAGLLLFGLLMGMMFYNSDQPVKWPKASRECLVADAKPLTDAQLIAVAVADWKKEGEQYTEEFREAQMGGSLISEGSLINWVNTDPGKPVLAYEMEEYGYNDLYKYARMGLSRYAVVSLELSGLKSAGHSTRRQYVYDACGHEL